jgi:hypothetical protein
MLETKIEALTAAIEANTAALQAVLAAGAAPSNVVPIETPKAAKGKAKAAPAPEPEDAPVAAEDRPTKVAVTETKAEEFSDPLDPDTTVVVPGTKIDADETISLITDTWKSMLTAADADRKTMLKDAYPGLRSKWGLAEGAKLSTLAGTPEKLVGLLEDIKAL